MAIALDLEALAREQLELRMRVELCPLEADRLRFVGGMDVSYVDGTALGVLVVLDTALREIGVFASERSEDFPYVPGFLAFREVPVLLDCFQKSKEAGLNIDLLFVDGQGIAHPRGLGVASHIGVLLGIPTIGVAKRRLFGTCKEPDVGEAQPLLDPQGTVIGYCYRPKRNASPIYVSPGHLCSVEDALEIVKKYLRGYRLPEPLRLAHNYTQRFKAVLKSRNQH